MGFVAPVTRSTGFVVGSTQWNEFVNNDLWIGRDRPTCLSKRLTAQNVATNSIVAATWDINHLDNAGSHSIAVNPSRFTAPVSGWYEMTVNVRWTAGISGFRTVSITVNGGGLSAGKDSRPASGASLESDQTVTARLHLAAGEYAEAIVFHDAGGPLDILIDSYVWFQWVLAY